ncbi:MAG: GNAT family N-acetyltransferase [Thermoanaerobaculia bacterium]
MIPDPKARGGARLLLRSPRAEDEREFVALAASSKRFLGGWVSPPADAQRFAAYLRRSQEINFEALLLIRREDRALLGAVNLSEIVRGVFQSAYLGYWIGAPYARQGYMREGLGLALDHAFKVLRLHRLEANIQPANTASKRLVESLGFRLEGLSPRYLKIGGRWRDHERWAILSEEWRA